LETWPCLPLTTQQSSTSHRATGYREELTSRALDFLYLSYSPPTPVTPLLPASIMARYQSVHNLLLRVCRVKTVLKSLYLDSVHQTPLFDEPVKQGVDAGSRPGTRASHTSLPADRVVQRLFPEGARVTFTLHRLRFRMSEFMAAIEQYLIDTAIGSNWDVMRRKLERLKRRAPGSDASIASTPIDEPDEFVTPDTVVYTEGSEGDDEDEEDVAGLAQLSSIDSLVVYHHHILDRILRACLLAPSAGQQVTFKVLMGLFGCILDLGKTVKEVERGSLGWEDGANRIQAYRQEWEEREKIFVSCKAIDEQAPYAQLHALERLSLRTTEKHDRAERAGEGDEHDLEILLAGDGDEHETGRGDDGGCLGELLVRLSFASASRA